MKLTFFWPKNNGAKWSRKNYFEIPPCAKLFFYYIKMPKIANSVIKMGDRQ